MKKNIFLMTLFCIYSSIFGVDFRTAGFYDLGEISDLYSNFTPDDYDKLVVYPPEVRLANIEDMVGQGKLFVAIESGKIIGFAKLFVIKDLQKVKTYLLDELSLGVKPCLNGSCIVTPEVISDYKHRLDFCGSALSDEVRSALLGGSCECLYLYYGGAYTIPTYRDKSINTQLVDFAMSSIFTEYKESNQFNYVALVYGQIQSNQYKQGMVRIFAYNLINLINSAHAQIFYFCCPACKPNLGFNNRTNEVAVVSFLPGFGNMVVAKLCEK